MEKFNGWSNYETWNIALWLDNDEFFYEIVKRAALRSSPYEFILSELKELGIEKTPDNVYFTDENINVEELNNSILND